MLFRRGGASLTCCGGNDTNGTDAKSYYDLIVQRRRGEVHPWPSDALLTPAGAAALVQGLVGHHQAKPFWNYTVEHKKNQLGD